MNGARGTSIDSKHLDRPLSRKTFKMSHSIIPDRQPEGWWKINWTMLLLALMAASSSVHGFEYEYIDSKEEDNDGNRINSDGRAGLFHGLFRFLTTQVMKHWQLSMQEMK
jgi:hypothetical protein